jgi:hypothetical protein
VVKEIGEEAEELLLGPMVLLDGCNGGVGGVSYSEKGKRF